MTKHKSLISAVQKGDLITVKELLDNGSNVNKPDKDGYTPLHWAAQEGFSQICNLLLERDADVNLPDNEGFTPLEVAVTKNQVGIVKKILESNANIHINRQGFTPLHASVAAGSEEVKAADQSFG